MMRKKGLENKPNILFIMADQLRPDFLGYDGAAWMDTPNIDRLAANGMVFNRCYTNSPVCAPARISLATGLRPHRVGSLDNLSYLPANARTYYKRLRDEEYFVGCVGKLDLAKPAHYLGVNGDRPACFSWGFTHPVECEGKYHAASRPFPFGPYSWYLHNKGLQKPFYEDYEKRKSNNAFLDASDSILSAEDFEDCYIGRRAAQWLEERPADFPFHLFVSFVGPHDPFDPPTEYAKLYANANVKPHIHDEGKGKPDRILKRMAAIQHATEAQIITLRRQYCAAIKAIDDAVGEILQALEKRSDAENTYIFFSSDHGEMLGDHGLPIKQVAYEHSWRVPLIVTGPGLQRGRQSDALIELMDVGETICDIVGLSRPPEVDARSFLHLLRKQTDSVPILDDHEGQSETEDRTVHADRTKGREERQAVTGSMQNNKHREYVLTLERPYRAIRTDRWKYIDTYNDMPELYDLEEDPDELRNLVDERPEIAARLAVTMRNGFAEGVWKKGAHG